MKITQLPTFSLRQVTKFVIFAVTIAGATIGTGAAMAQEETVTAHDALAAQVTRYLQEQLTTLNEDVNLQVDVTPIDARIELPECSGGYVFDSDPTTYDKTYVSVRVSCNDNQWYLFTNAKILRTQSIVVTASMISPGTVLSRQNLRVAEVEVNRLRHTPYVDIDTLVGARLKYRVRQGQAVQANMLCFVCEGDRVTISAQTDLMEVKTSGIAQQDGVIGDTIEVVNAASKKALIAEITSTQEVVVRL